jgi:hypothetical protein
MRTRCFTVSPETWAEHYRVGIAAINDPYCSGGNNQIYATRQKVLPELSGIRPGDRLFFYVQRTKEIMGGFQATSEPFFDQNPLFNGATRIDNRFPFRLGFCQVVNYPRPVHVNEIWAGRDSGVFWTMQQARGDVVGRHACWPLTHREGDLLEQMLMELNVVVTEPQNVPPLPKNRQPLPYDMRIVGTKYPHLNYEASLQSHLLEGMADGKWRNIFGEYDDFLPSVSTSEGKEIDILLLRHDNNNHILWFQILELKSDRFVHDDLLQILAYEQWMTSSNQVGGNPRSVHIFAVANRYDESVMEHIKARAALKQKPIRLLTYRYTPEEGLLLAEIPIE